jgi:hypothetical protein
MASNILEFLGDAPSDQSVEVQKARNFTECPFGAPIPRGWSRALKLGGQSTNTIDQVALAFTTPSDLRPTKVYEQAILAEL